MVTTLALSLFLASAAEDSFNFTRQPKVDARYSYDMTATISEGGQELIFKGTTVFKFKKSLDGGKSEWDIAVVKGELEAMGSKTDLTKDPQKFVLDGYGLPEIIAIKDTDIPLALTFLMGITPSKELKVGESANVDWKSKDKTQVFKGVFKLSAMNDKTVTLVNKGTMEPEGESAGELEWTSEIEKSTGIMLSAKGSILIDNAKVNIVIKPS